MKYLQVKTLLRIITVIWIILSIPSLPVLAINTQDVTIAATPLVTGGIANFTITYVNDYRLDLDWQRTGDAANVMVRVKNGSYPTDRDDGYLVYYGDLLSYSDESVNLEDNASTLYYRAWAQTGGGTWYDDAAENFWESVGMTLIALGLLAVGLTVAMFATKQAMLGFACALFWAVIGGYTYTLSSTPWGDWQYLLSMSCLMGMIPFCMYGAYALRTKKQEAIEGDQLIDEGGDRNITFIDEVRQPKKEKEEEPSRISRVRKRALLRRKYGIRRKLSL